MSDIREIDKKLKEQKKLNKSIKNQNNYYNNQNKNKKQIKKEYYNENIFELIFNKLIFIIDDFTGSLKTTPFILIKIEYISKYGEILTLNEDFDFDKVRSLYIKDLRTNQRRRLFCQEIESYSVSGNYLYVKLRNSNERYKIRCA
jgi:hypothetical protein